MKKVKRQKFDLENKMKNNIESCTTPAETFGLLRDGNWLSGNSPSMAFTIALRDLCTVGYISDLLRSCLSGGHCDHNHSINLRRLLQRRERPKLASRRLLPGYGTHFVRMKFTQPIR